MKPSAPLSSYPDPQSLLPPILLPKLKQSYKSSGTEKGIFILVLSKKQDKLLSFGWLFS